LEQIMKKRNFFGLVAAFFLVASLILGAHIVVAGESYPGAHDWNGYVPLADQNGNLTRNNNVFIPDTAVLTDAAPTRTYIVGTGSINDLAGFLLADKGCTLTVYPLPVFGKTTRAKASTVLTIGAGGVTVAEPWKYSEIGTPAAEIVITKTEAGDMTSFMFTARGR
jgi:hypothetical protein